MHSSNPSFIRILKEDEKRPFMEEAERLRQVSSFTHFKVLKCFILIVFDSSMKNYVWSRTLSQLHKRQHPDYKYQPRRRRGQGADSPSIGGKGIVNIVTLAILSILFTLATLSHCQYCHIVNIVNIVNKRVPSLSFLVFFDILLFSEEPLTPPHTPSEEDRLRLRGGFLLI